MISRSSVGRFSATLASSCWNLAVSSFSSFCEAGCGLVAMFNYNLKAFRKREVKRSEGALLGRFILRPCSARMLPRLQIHLKRHFFIGHRVPAMAQELVHVDLRNRQAFPGKPFCSPSKA